MPVAATPRRRRVDAPPPARFIRTTVWVFAGWAGDEGVACFREPERRRAAGFGRSESAKPVTDPRSARAVHGPEARPKLEVEARHELQDSAQSSGGHRDFKFRRPLCPPKHRAEKPQRRTDGEVHGSDAWFCNRSSPCRDCVVTSWQVRRRLLPRAEFTPPRATRAKSRNPSGTHRRKTACLYCRRRTRRAAKSAR